MIRLFPRSRRADRSSRPSAAGPGWLRPALPVVVALIAALVVPSAAFAQQDAPDRRQILTQLQQITRQLRPIQQQALKDSALRAQRDSLTKLIRDRMKAQSQSTAAQVDSMDQLQEDMRSAQKAGDTARMKELQGALRRMSRSLTPARKRAMQSPEIRKRLRAFRKALRAKMREIDPKAARLISRADSLRALLRGQQGGGGAGSGG